MLSNQGIGGLGLRIPDRIPGSKVWIQVSASRAVGVEGYALAGEDSQPFIPC